MSELINIDEKEADWLRQMRSDDGILKSKTYIKDPSEAPKGASVQRGPKGGIYYETDIVLPLSSEERRLWQYAGGGRGIDTPSSMPGWRKDVLEMENILDDFLGGMADEWMATDEMPRGPSGVDSHLAQLITDLKRRFRQALFEKKEGYPTLLNSFLGVGRKLKEKNLKGEKALDWWYSHVHGWFLNATSSDAILLKTMAKNFLTSGGMIKKFREGINYTPYPDGEFGSPSEKVKITKEDYDGFVANYQYSQEVLREKFPSGFVKLYRGIGIESYDKWVSAGRPTNVPFKSSALSSWSSDYHRAEGFARTSAAGSTLAEQLGAGMTGSGLVIKKEMPTSKVFVSWHSSPGFQPSTEDWQGEDEFIIIGSRKDEATVEVSFKEGKAEEFWSG
ncbi:hypothetical protein CMI41_02410 [Candidatus Pacearchaeota archaeon]|nr:hypothetical protein [Candidatus Pacearchaeota archaeon]